MVDNWNHLAQVFGQYAEEQYLVAIVERRQIDILTYRIRQQLTQNGVDASLVRITDVAKN